jgi:hypothetical protein
MGGIGNKQEFLSGLTLIGFGIAGLVIARNYPMGTAFRMGPGYFPMVLSGLLIAIGLVVAGGALQSGQGAMSGIAWRPLIVVTAATVLFGLLIDRAGLLLATLIMALASRLARPGYPWGETVLLAVALSAMCAAIFYFGLKVQMPLLPTWG